MGGPDGRDTSSGSAEPVSIDLSADQVAQVVRAASDGGRLSVLLSGLDDVRETLVARSAELENRSLSRSLLVGFVVLTSMPADGGYVGVVELARRTGSSPSTTHRYLSTLMTVGLVERDPRTREYRLAL
ncbi:MAG: helix-turn-helix domain-containing protein [Solirubrobacteraceae bacterium]